VEVEPGGSLFFVDQLQPGRVGHDEAWQWDRLCLELSVRAAGELILRERLDQTGAELRALAGLNGSGPAACFANAVLIGSVPGGPWLDEVKHLHGEGLWIGASALRHSGWSIRLVAADSVKLRQALRDVRRILSSAFPRLGADLRKL